MSELTSKMEGMDLEESSSSRGPVKRGHTGMQFGDHCSTNFHGSVNMLVTTTPEPPQKKSRIEFKVQDPIESFTGREDILETLHKTIQQSKSVERVTVLSKAKVVTGMGGLGKTETIRKYAFDYKHSYGHTLWINAETYSQAKDCFIEIASLCNVSSENFDSRRAVILGQIYDYLCEEPCLLVFDNAESMGTADSKEGIRPFLPLAVKTGWVPPAIVATSRNRAWGQAALIELPGLNDDECFALLTRQLKLSDTQENRECARRITEMCEGLPLVVQQVIAIIRATNKDREVFGESTFTLQDFLSEVEGGGLEFTNTVPADCPVGLPAFQIFKMAFVKILEQENGGLAFRCLSVMAWLNPDGIPAKLLLALMAPVTTDKAALAGALNMLRDQNLVTLHNKSYRIHRIVQLVSIRLTNNECGTEGTASLKPNKKYLGTGIRGMPAIRFTSVDGLSDIIRRFRNVFGDFPLNGESLNGVLQSGLIIASHLKKHKHSEAEGTMCYFYLDALARKLADAGRHSEAETVWEDLLAIYASGKETSKLKLHAKHELARACLEQGKPDAAFKIYKEVLETQESELGTDHEDTLETKKRMAGLDQYPGEYDAAIELHEYVLKNQEIKFGRNISRNASTKHNLASALQESGKDKIESEGKYAIIKYIELQLGPNDRVTLSAKVFLARFLQQIGKYDEAVKMFEDALKGRESELGPIHIDTLRTKSMLASALNDKGEDQKAFQLFKETLKALMTHVGPDHTDTLVTKHNFACLHNMLGTYDTALEMFEDVLKRREKVLGADHRMTIRTKKVLADILCDKEDYERASGLYEEVLKFQHSFYGPSSPKTLTTKCSLAYSFTKIGKYGAALEIYQQILEHQETSMGPIHPDTLGTKHNMAWNLRKQGRYDEALRACEDILNSLKEDPDVIYNGTMGIKDEIARIYAHQGKYIKASELYEEVLKFQHSFYGPDSPEALTTKSCLAYSFTKIGKYGAAMEIYQQILEHEEKSLGPDHPDTWETKNNMAYILRKQGRYDEALRACEDILNRVKQAPDVIDFEIMATKDEIARIYAYQGKYEDAVELFEEVLEHCTESLGPDHSITKKVAKGLRKALEGKANCTERQRTNQDV